MAERGAAERESLTRNFPGFEAVGCTHVLGTKAHQALQRAACPELDWSTELPLMSAARPAAARGPHISEGLPWHSTSGCRQTGQVLLEVHGKATAGHPAASNFSGYQLVAHFSYSTITVLRGNYSGWAGGRGLQGINFWIKRDYTKFVRQVFSVPSVVGPSAMFENN